MLLAERVQRVLSTRIGGLMLYEFKSSILHRQCVGDMVGSYKKGSSQPSAQVSREQYQPTPHNRCLPET